jgi:hypothetical protein
VTLLRWDTYDPLTYPCLDLSGIALYAHDDKFHLYAERAAPEPELNCPGRSADLRDLSPAFDIPEGKWVHLLVYQRFSEVDGVALNAVYLDGSPVGPLSRDRNTWGEKITSVRFGIVSIAQGLVPTSWLSPINLFFDCVALNRYCPTG